MPIENYVIGDVIGKGSYGEVTLASNKKDKKKYVIKKIDLHNANAKERTFAQQEVEILSKLRHPNIVSYKESFQTNDGHLAIIMGYCEGGDLYTKLKKQAKQGEFLTETQIVEWFVQIAMALQYMHDRNILHRDLKTQNIFLTKSKIIKLGDLGIARVLDSNADMATTMIGTPYYMSPELFSNKPYNHKSDVWALGCCVYEMATLKHAFNAKDMNSLVYKILKGKTPTMPKHYSEELLEIIRSMLKYEPSSRPSASRILRHAFIKKHIALFLEGTKNRHKKKSRDEKPKTSVTPTKQRTSTDTKQQSPSSKSKKSADRVEQPSEEGLATASKVDIILIDDPKNNENVEKVQNSSHGNHNKDSPYNKREPNNNNNEKDSIKDDIPSRENRHRHKRVGESVRKIDTPEKDIHTDVVVPNKEKHRIKKTESSPRKNETSELDHHNRDVKNPSHVRKILHERIQAKARLKEKRDLEAKQRKSLEHQSERVSSASSQEDRSERNGSGDGVRKTSKDRKRSQEKKQDNSRRPLPVLRTEAGIQEETRSGLPRPRFKNDDTRESRVQEKDQKLNEENPKMSAGVPNMAARRKRRQRLQESQPQFSPPTTSSVVTRKIESRPALSCPSFPRKSREEIIRSHLQRNSIQHEEFDVVDGHQPQSPPSDEKEVDEDESSGSDEVIVSSHGKGSDVMNLIDTLQATLKMDAGGVGGGGLDNRKSPEESVEMQDEDELSPTVSGRLKDRITRLRRECIEGIGIEVLKKAYQIIDSHQEEKAEPLMRDLLGEKFDDFSGRIWQLKFCEEFK
ncbi:serine/threonine-protein kinase Nek4-like [Clytia hemisphaerica]|uniref:non-specific serine/threonine protein kinase n=1 Tax=Clytia hemisphaerica TaxID=252671 RepID=A0A7M6DR26_9CNID|eukprot:TCONS_00051188-protein